jgi:hypothetical protein
MPQFGLFATFVERFRAGFSEGKSLICWLPSRGQTLQLSLLLVSRLKVRFLPRSPLTLANIYAVFFASGTDAKFVEFRSGQHSVSIFGESRSGLWSRTKMSVMRIFEHLPASSGAKLAIH